MAYSTTDTIERREKDLANVIADLESPRQGYRVERVTRFTNCGRCHRTGRLQIKPKGWRKKTLPPWFMCTQAPCPDCSGKGRLEETTTDRVWGGE